MNVRLVVPRRSTIPVSEKERPIRGPGTMRQILRVQGWRADGETVPGRIGVRPAEQKGEQMRPAVQRGLRRPYRAP